MGDKIIDIRRIEDLINSFTELTREDQEKITGEVYIKKLKKDMQNSRNCSSEDADKIFSKRMVFISAMLELDDSQLRELFYLLKTEANIDVMHGIDQIREKKNSNIEIDIKISNRK